MASGRFRALLGLLCVAGICSSSTVLAVQDTITASLGTLLENIETVLEQQQLTLVEQAQTERFTLMYASRDDGAHVTITVRQLPLEATRIVLTVVTDSPQDEVFDARLLQKLTARND